MDIFSKKLKHYILIISTKIKVEYYKPEFNQDKHLKN